MENTMPLNNTKLCPSCKKSIPLIDKFCGYCGKSTVRLSAKQAKEIKTASGWVLAISIMFVIFGTIFGFIQKAEAEKAYANISHFEDSQICATPVNGEMITFGELRSQITSEVSFIFITNYFLAAIMFILYLWARRSPFPALVTALCIYLAVIVLNALIDPTTIVQGILIKIIFISALVAGIKSSLAARSIS